MFVIQKFLSILTFLIYILNFNSISEAYPAYLDGNRNLLFVGSRGEYAWYMDKRTLAVEKYDPPVYVISFDMIHIGPTFGPKVTDKRTVDRRCWLYQWNQKKMYVLFDGSWRYIPPIGSHPETIAGVEGEMAFYVAYRMKFYGDLELTPKDNTHNELAIRDGSLYLIVDGSE